MESFSKWWASLPGWVKVALVLIVLGVFGKMVGKEEPISPAPEYAPAPAPKKNYDAYGMACEFVKRQLNTSAPVKFIWTDEVEDFGDNEWFVSGDLETQNDYGATVYFHWTVQITRDGSDKWSLVYPAVIRPGRK